VSKTDMVRKALDDIPSPPRRTEYHDSVAYLSALRQWREDRLLVLLNLCHSLLVREHLHDRVEGCQHGEFRGTNRWCSYCDCGALDHNEASRLLNNYLRELLT
jgi:hypothetical protein